MRQAAAALLILVVAWSGAAWAGDANAYAVLRDFGFPALVTAFVLVRVESRLRELSAAIVNLTIALVRHGIDVRRPPEGDGRAAP